MTELTLTANGNAQERILAYLKENASEVLAEKINNGTAIEKDGKKLINKKTLDGFMKYANDEARKLADKGANYACIEDDTVFGWAIHYFEEDSIEGTLFNEDGSEYKPEVKVTPKKKETTPTPIAVSKPKQASGQTSLFDLIESQLENKTEDKEQSDETEDNQDNAELEEQPTIQNNLPQFYTQYLDIQKKYPQDIVLTKLGDFYEAFGDNAVTLSNELDLTLTGRNVGLEERVPLVGFPYHTADIYIGKIRSKHNVVVIEQDDVKRLTQTIQANDGNTVEIETGEVLDECTPYVDLLSALLKCPIKFVGEKLC